MREDINKVVTERPRRCHWARMERHRKGYVFNKNASLEEMEEVGSAAYAKAAYRKLQTKEKGFSDLLGPIYSFLRSRCGQRWDDVYSEISAVFNAGSWQGSHIKEHINEAVHQKTFYDENGKLWANDGGWSGSRPMELTVERRWGVGRPEFYVEPGTGILRELKKVKIKPTKWKKTPNEVWFCDGTSAVGATSKKHIQVWKIHDIWYLVHMTSSITISPLNKKIEYNEENGKLRVSAIRIPGDANLLNVFGGVKNNQPLGSNAGELMFDAFGNVAAHGIEKFSSIPVKMKQMSRREMARFASHMQKAEEMYAGREA